MAASTASVRNSRVLAAERPEKDVPHLLLELPDRGHGFQHNGVDYSGPSWEAWQTGSLAWLAALPTPTTAP